MKKVIIILFIVSLGFIFNSKEHDILIPNNAIRFRVIANSNNLVDQNEKTVIKNKIENEVYSLINNATNTDEVKSIIENNMNKIEEIINKYDVPYKIDFGYNYFPTKNYKGVLYQAGNYESLVITLGEGLGNNYWCVLFPPLCLLENDAQDVSDVKYQFYVKKILDQF